MAMHQMPPGFSGTAADRHLGLRRGDRAGTGRSHGGQSGHRCIVARVASREMQEPTFLVLTCLAGGRRHGYALLQEVAEVSAGRVRLRPGSLYEVLDRLLETHLVAVTGEERVDGRLRRYYELTDAGAAALGTEVERLRANANRAAAGLRGWTAAAG